MNIRYVFILHIDDSKSIAYDFSSISQTKKNMAFENTLFVEQAVKHLSAVPPTKLIQSYYSCVLSEWEAAYNASGLAASNTQLYIGLAFLVYMYFSVLYFQKFTADGKEKVKWKVAKLKEEELQKKHADEFVEALQQDVQEGFVVRISISTKLNTISDILVTLFIYLF